MGNDHEAGTFPETGYSSTLSFLLNNEQVLLQNPEPTTLLIDFLRSPAIDLTGSKLVCGEGGCGACTVMLTYRTPVGRVVERAINACLHPLCALDGAAVTTIEGIGSTRTGMNPIQSRIAECNGSQCGFCTPGFVMNMYGLLRNNPNPSPQEIEDGFDGNLCRCTGYRPILDAMQSFADEPEVRQVAASSPAHSIVLGEHRRLHFSGSGYEWFRPLKLDEALALLARFYTTQQTVKLVNGNTSIGIYKRDVDDPHVLIDIAQIAELQAILPAPDGLHVGAGITFTTLLEVLNRVIDDIEEQQAVGLRALRDHVRRIANTQVRNIASLAGNLMLAFSHANHGTPFPSDLLLVLATLGATVTLRCPEQPHEDLIYPILEMPPLDTFPKGFVIVSVFLPFSQPGDYVHTYKIARRPQNSHALVNAGFRVQLDAANTVVGSTLVYGGIAALPFRAERTELCLRGRVWSWVTLEEALQQIRIEVAEHIIDMPEDGVSNAYRSSLTESLFYKYFISVALQVDSSVVPERDVSAGDPYIRPISRGLEIMTLYPDEFPVSAPIIKTSAYIQATGEATYTHDLPAPASTLFAVYVYSQRSYATFTYERAGGLAALVQTIRRRFPGVRDYITAVDIPPGGQNMQGLGGDDPIFADGMVNCYGLPIGLVVAATPRAAQLAADYIQENALTYTDLTPVVTTIDEALALPDEAGIFQDDPSRGLTHIHSIARPGSDMAWIEHPTPEPGRVFVSGTQHTGAQAHFYLETQAALVVPGDDQTIRLFASTQDLASCQSAIAAVLHIPINKVRAEVVRVGGGFGGKETRSPLIAAAAAVAAWKLNRPIRLVLDRNTDMTMIGNRHPFKGTYYASVDPDGRIQKMRIDYWSNAGNTYDVSFPVMDLVMLGTDGAYMVDTLGATGTCCRTNRTSRTAMRSFGLIQCAQIMEDAIEQIAYRLGMLPEDVRKKNLYQDATEHSWPVTHYGQPLKDCRINEIWNRLLERADFYAREREVRTFNAANRWRKRGISMVPLKYGISYTYKPANQGGALVVVYDGDGTVLLQHGGVEMGQGLHTKMIQIAAEVLGISMDLIYIPETDTDVVPNASSTGASTGSDLNGWAVKMACRELRERLERFCQHHEHEPNFPDWRNDWANVWPQIISRAYAARINLSAQAFYRSPGLSQVDQEHPIGAPFYYFSYSAAVAEVEIDVLTGECTILRADMLYDAGKSLNPLLDIGQIQGGFIQGVGNVMTEQIYYAEDGRLIPDGTWNYKPPCSKSIPVDFRVALYSYAQRISPLDRTPIDHHGIQSSKSTGEPPLVLSSSVFFAIKHAILSAREDAGVTGWFELESPATVAVIQQACLPNVERRE